MHAASTATVPPMRRVEFWEHLVSQHVTPMRIRPQGQDFHGEVQTRLIGSVSVSRVSGQGIRAVHEAPEIARTATHLCAACVHLEGHARVQRGGMEAELQPGDVFITDSRDAFALHLEEPWTHLVLTLPAASMQSRGRPGLLSAEISRKQGLAGLWSQHLANAFRFCEGISAPAARLIERQLIDLLQQLLEDDAGRDGGPRTAQEAAFNAACHVISLRCTDPALSPDAIARSLDMSSRTLARIFAANGQTVMRRVYDERLERAARLLASTGASERSVTDIAFACGFNDISHFGRQFAARLQMTPTEWRRRNR